MVTVNFKFNTNELRKDKGYYCVNIRYSSLEKKTKGLKYSDTQISVGYLKILKKEWTGLSITDDKKNCILDNIKKELQSYVNSLTDNIYFSDKKIKKIVESHNPKNKLNFEKLKVFDCIYKGYVNEKEKYNNGEINISTKTLKNYLDTVNSYKRYKDTHQSLNNLCVKDLDNKWFNSYEKWLFNDEKYTFETSRIHCRLARKLLKRIVGNKKNNVLNVPFSIPRPKNSPIKQVITFEEIKLISKTDFSYVEFPEQYKKYQKIDLNIIRDWMIIGWHIGQRFEDLQNLDFSQIDGEILRNVYQQKGKKNVPVIPIFAGFTHWLKSNDKFPRKYSLVYFNVGMKMICKHIGMNKIVEASISQTLENGDRRNIIQKYEKWETISSHCLRRSYATYMYKKFPEKIDYIMLITGHKSLKDFYRYIQLSLLEKATDFLQEISNTVWDLES